MERRWRFPEPILPLAKTGDGTGRQARSVLSKGGRFAAAAGSRAALPADAGLTPAAEGCAVALRTGTATVRLNAGCEAAVVERASPDGPQDWPGRLRSRLTNRTPRPGPSVHGKECG
ncbi:hypothetical protein [Gluconobacter cerinus]|uniref:hypothetical protein n=1 Tax=Gluconobacter cerinus TaxID=38307 RepID=UPI001B8B5AE7|nr:hypothetical protein [Gluconobacter cerinus]MBS1035817.1 hypothetical protein [Gluconobacter cerinus]